MDAPGGAHHIFRRPGRLLVLVSLNLKVLVGTARVGYIAEAAVIAVGAAGWLLAARLKKTRPDVYATIGISSRRGAHQSQPSSRATGLRWVSTRAGTFDAKVTRG